MNRVSRATFLKAAFVACAGGAAALTPPAAAEVKGEPPEAAMKHLLESTKKGSYDDFLADCDDQVRASLSKQNFEGVAATLGPRLREGYKTSYLAKLRQGGGVTYLWKVEFKDGKDEHLLKVSVKNGKISGALIQ
jgi:hypothetical protein